MSNFPTLDGLNNIDGDNGNLTNITCETFIATVSAQVPTVLPGSNDNNVASTAFVSDAVSTATGNLVTLDTSQTLTTGVKTFTNLPQCAATVSNNLDLVNKVYVDDNFINIIGDQTLTTGVKTFTVLPQSTAIPSNNKDLTNKSYVDSNFVNLTGNQTLTTGIKTFTNLPQCSATVSNNSDLTNKLYVDNIVSGLTGTYVSLAGNQTLTTGIKTFTNLPQCSATVSNNDDLVNKLYVDNIFSGVTGVTGGAFVTLSGDQTLTTGIKTFTNLPQSSATPSNNLDLTTKLYVDNLFSGATGPTGAFVTLSGDQTLTAGIKTFTNLPQSSATPSNNDDLINKLYVDNIISGLTGTYITLGTTQTLTTGIKTFTNLPQSTATPSNNADLVNKLYVDNAVSGITGSFVTLAGNQVLTTGKKTFTNLPECTAIPSNNADFTNKLYVDTNFVNLVGNQTLTTGIKTFTNLPQSTATPSVNDDLTNKLYVDNAVAGIVGATGTFVTLGTTQTITGNKDFTGNNIIECSTGTNIIRGNQVDIFPTITYLTSPTTTISGTNCNITSTTNYIAGTTTYLASPTVVVNSTCNSFYVDASYSNFVGAYTLLQSPYTTISSLCNICEINPVTLRLQSPTIDLQNTCSTFTVNASTTNMTGTALNISSPTTTISSTNTNFTGTNTDLTATNATAATQIFSDNSTKLATTAYVNSHVSGSYMTLTTNQNVSGIKTYSTKQVFNAGTACSTYDATGVTDMTLASNAIKGILTIKDNIVCDEVGSRIQYEGGNVQLNTGFFIESDVTQTPSVNFPLNQSTAYVNTVFNTADANKKITSGLQFWAGNSQTTNFEISHSITNISLSTIAVLIETKIYFTFIDENTGITRYVSPINLADTTPFLISGASTVVRPNVTFSLTSIDLPEANYHVYAYSEITGKANNSLSVNWNLSNTATSPYVTVKNYNTPITDVIMTNRIVKNCMRNCVAGIYLINNISTSQNIMLPIFYSCTDLLNITSQPSTSGAVPTTDGGAFSGEVGVGNYDLVGCNNKDNYWLVYPNYGLKVYNTTGFGGTVYINYRNKTSNPVVVSGTTSQVGSSCRIYFDSVELEAF